MSIWVHRLFAATDMEACERAQGEFAELFAAIGSPSNMLLLSVETERETRLVASLPHPVLLQALHGFTRTANEGLPESGELVVGWEDSFERQFRYQPTPAC